MNPLKIGWIDYSSEHREKVIAVLDALSKEGAVDELGIGRIRDGFADILFPGTSTIQTRAKYFFIIPYILMELERESFSSPNEFINKLSNAEVELIETLIQKNPKGVIGAQSGRKLQRKPSTIYWNGLRTFGFFKENISLPMYAQALYSLKSNKNLARSLGTDLEDDINNIDGEHTTSFWRCLLPDDHWQEKITIDLSNREANYLRERIISSTGSKESLLAYLLSNLDQDKLAMITDFDAIGDMFMLPDHIKEDYLRAKKFNQFITGANIRYNMILSQGKNQDANEYWQQWLNSHFVQNEFSSFQYEDITSRLKIGNTQLRLFLRKWHEAVLYGEETTIDKLIINREIELKGKDRAKLNNTENYRYEKGTWLGARNLDYRFSNTKVIMNDIFAGLEEYPNHVTAS